MGGSRGTRCRAHGSIGGDGGESNSPSRTLCRRPLRACPMLCRRSCDPASAPSRRAQSRPLAGFASSYVTLPRGASPLDDASTARGDEAASTLTLRPKPRGREQAGGCQLLRFAACLTRPDGTSARVPRGSSPVETTHPQDDRVIACERLFGQAARFGRARDAALERGAASATALDVGHLALHVASRVALGDVAPAVVQLLAARERELDLGAPAAVVEVDAQRHERESLGARSTLRAGRSGPGAAAACGRAAARGCSGCRPARARHGRRRARPRPSRCARTRPGG